MLPVVAQVFLPKYTNPVEIEQIRTNVQKIQQMYYNRSAKDLSPIKAGKKVWGEQHENEKLNKVVVTENLLYSSRSYTLPLDSGGKISRNRRFIRLRKIDIQDIDSHMCVLPEFTW
jgi:hypothetical protein